MFDTREYIKENQNSLEKLKAGVSHAFVIHYFWSNTGNRGLEEKDPLYALMRETCPLADKVMREEFVAKKGTKQGRKSFSGR